MILRGFIDESYDKNVFVLSALLAVGTEWRWLSRDWMACLGKWNERLLAQGRKPITRFHASECNSLDNEFEGWAREEQIELTAQLVKILGRTQMHSLGLALDMEAFHRAGSAEFGIFTLCGSTLRNHGKPQSFSEAKLCATDWVIMPRIMGWSNLLSFALGLLSGLLLGEVHEHYRRRLSLSSRVYEPLYAQLVRIRPDIERREVLKENPVWAKVVESGLRTKVRKSMRLKIEHLYEASLPAYYQAYTGALHRLLDVLEKWDGQFGTEHHPQLTPYLFQWWSFLLAEEFSPPKVALGDAQYVQLYNKEIKTAVLAALKVSLPEFLRARWNEAKDDPAFVSYRTTRRKLLVEIDDTIAMLDHLVIA